MDTPEQVFNVQLNTADGHVAVAGLMKVQQALASLSCAIDSGEEAINIPALQLILRSGLDGSQKLSGLFSARMDPIFYNERRTPNSTSAVVTTFATTELLEMVLLNLSIRSLLASQSVNQKFLNTIEKSKKIQQKLRLQPTGSPMFSTILPEKDRRSFSYPYEDYGDSALTYGVRVPGGRMKDGLLKEFFAGGPILEMNFFIYFDRRALPVTVGKRWCKMLVCEPVVTRLGVYPDCCGSWGDREILERTDDADITNNAGVTIGDMLRAIKSARKKHQHCARWPKGSAVRFTFHSIIKVRSDDPVATCFLNLATKSVEQSGVEGPGSDSEDDMALTPGAEVTPSDEGVSDDGDYLSEHVHGYEDAKEIAARNGQRSPTFEDFEKIGGSSWQYRARKDLN